MYYCKFFIIHGVVGDAYFGNFMGVICRILKLVPNLFTQTKFCMLI